MESVAVRKAKELNEPVRQWIGGLFGRDLQDEEEVTVLVFPPHPAPSRAAILEAGARIDRILDKAAANMKDVPAEEFDAAVDEAMEHVRRRGS